MRRELESRAMTVPPIEPGSTPSDPDSLPEFFAEQEAAEATTGDPDGEESEQEVDAALVEQPPRPPLLARAWRSAKGWLFSFATVFLAIVLAEILRHPLAPLSAALAAHFELVRNALLGTVVLGGVLVAAGFAALAREGVSLGASDFGHRLQKSREAGGEAAGWRREERLSRRRGGGSGFEVRFGQVKEALRLAGWWREPACAGMVAAVAGGLILAFGFLAFFVLYGPGWVKVLVGGWMLYALARIAWGFWKA